MSVKKRTHAAKRPRPDLYGPVSGHFEPNVPTLAPPPYLGMDLHESDSKEIREASGVETETSDHVKMGPPIPAVLSASHASGPVALPPPPVLDTSSPIVPEPVMSEPLNAYGPVPINTPVSNFSGAIPNEGEDEFSVVPLNHEDPWETPEDPSDSFGPPTPPSLPLMHMHSAPQP